MATQTHTKNALTLEDDESFEFLSGLWTGKKPPFTKAVVIRNTNFSNDGKIDYSNIAVLDVEAKQLQTRKLQSGDIIIERSGGGPKQPVGRVVYFEKKTPEIPYSFSNFTSTIRVKKNFDSRYVFYFLHNFYTEGNTDHLQRRTTGIRNLDFKSYKESVVFPSISIKEQEVIAKSLVTVQDAIAEQEKVIANLKALKRSMMQHLFTHGTKGDKTKITEIGEIPESWTIQSIGNIALVTKLAGYEYTKHIKYDDAGEIIAIRGLNLKNGELDLSNVQRISRSVSNSLLRSKLFPGDVLLSYVGTVGGVAVVHESDKYHLAPNVAKLTPKDTKVLRSQFLAHILQSDAGRRELFLSVSKTSQPVISMARIRSLQICLPPIDEQDAICEILMNLNKKISAINQKLNLYQNLFKTLLHELMSGERRVNI